jgi:hypothetical protein
MLLYLGMMMIILVVFGQYDCTNFSDIYIIYNILFLSIRYQSTMVDGNIVQPMETNMMFRTERKVPKVGC